MSKVEKYIQDYTRRCSNVLVSVQSKAIEEIISYNPWLTPDQARIVANIAREEVIEEAYKWLEENSQKYVYWMDEEFGKEDLIEDFKKYFKNE